MAAPSPEVLQDINSLVSVVTGFKVNQENFAACKKYCISHFIHHSYPSISKSTVQSALKEFERRLYIQARFELSNALTEQVNHFLSNEETFKNNPECQIEWNVLSLIISLASNLSNVYDVPVLLPLDNKEPLTEDFDWTSYLKADLPVYQYDTGSDSFSSLSSSESDNSPVSKSTGNFESALDEISLTSLNEPKSPNEKIQIQRKDFLKKLKSREDELSFEKDITTRGNVAYQWRDLLLSLGREISPLIIISEKEAVEKILYCLVTGDNLSELLKCTVSFLSKDAFSSFLNILEPYVTAMNEFNCFIKSCETNNANSVVVQTYASCLQHYLMQYELKMLEINNDSLSLVQLLQPIQPCLPYILGLASAHKSCVSALGNEPCHVTALRVISVLYNSMIASHRQDLRSTFLGMFLSCLAVFGDIINEVLNPDREVIIHQEFFMERHISTDNTECEYLFKSECKDLLTNFKLAGIIASKIQESSPSISLVYILNKIRYRNDTIKNQTSINERLYNTLHSSYCCDENQSHGQMQTAMADMSSLALQIQSLKCFDFLQVPRWVEKSANNHIPIHKVVCDAMINAIEEKLSQIQTYAINILVTEMCLDKHLNMLRRVFLFNDASILLPFTTVYFKEDSYWGNSDYLTFAIRECLSTDYPDLIENISVSVSPGKSASYQNIVEAIDCITIIYQVPYPISLVLTADVMKKYNAIFRVLLKVKWSHTLVHLPFPDKKFEFTPAAKHVLHRLQILRFSYLADLNVLQNYFLAQVAATLSRSSEYKDIQTLIIDHENLINRIYARCMLSEGDQYYNLIFDSVMPLCFTLRSTWYLQDTHIVATLKKMETIFRTNHAKLQTIMVSLEKETYVPLMVKPENTTYHSNPTLHNIQSSMSKCFK